MCLCRRERDSESDVFVFTGIRVLVCFLFFSVAMTAWRVHPFANNNKPQCLCAATWPEIQTCREKSGEKNIADTFWSVPQSCSLLSHYIFSTPLFYWAFVQVVHLRKIPSHLVCATCTCRYLLFKHKQGTQKTNRHTCILGYTHNNYHQTADKSSSGHVGAVQQWWQVEGRVSFNGVFWSGISSVRKPLDLHILPGTISLSLPILQASHHSPSKTVTDFSAKASVLTFAISHFYFCLSVHPVHFIHRNPPNSQFLNVSRSWGNWYWELPTGQSIALLTSSCPPLCLFLPAPPVPSAHQEANNFLPVFEAGGEMDDRVTVWRGSCAYACTGVMCERAKLQNRNQNRREYNQKWNSLT